MSEAFTSQLSIEAVVVLLAAAAAVVFVNIIPSLSDPFEMLFTMIHELGHVVSSRITGGEVESYTVDPPGHGGVTRLNPRRPGNLFIVGPAGYLATPLLSAALIVLSAWPYAARYTLAIFGLLMLLSVMRYGNLTSFTTVLTGAGFGAGLIWIAWQAALVWTVFWLYFLALQGVWTGLNDLRILSVLISRDPPSTDDDASKMSQLFGCAPAVWVLSWLIISVVSLAASFWFIWLRPLF